jgi:hypothetical protein
MRPNDRDSKALACVSCANLRSVYYAFRCQTELCFACYEYFIGFPVDICWIEPVTSVEDYIIGNTNQIFVIIHGEVDYPQAKPIVHLWQRAYKPTLYLAIFQIYQHLIRFLRKNDGF